MTRNRIAVLALIAVAALPVSATLGEEVVVDRGLGADGQLISLLRGTYGELFPHGAAADAEEPALALETTFADGTRRREVVPATLDYDREESPKLIVESMSGAAFVFWQSWKTHIHSNFRVASFDGEQWSKPIDVAGPSWSWKLAPAFAVTHDRFVGLSGSEAESGSLVERTVIHVMWIEETTDSKWRTFYTPLVLEDGRFIGGTPILVMEDLVPTGGEELGTDLRIAPVLRPRDGENGVVAAFVDQRTGRLVAMDLRFAAGELSILGDAVADAIQQAEAAKLGADGVAAAARARLQAFSGALKAAILDPISVEIETLLRMQDGASGASSLADDARKRLLETGFNLTDGNVRRVVGVARPHIISFGARSDHPRTSRRHDARASVAVQRALPTALPAAPEVLVSSKGTQLVLAWREKDRVRYQESKADGGWNAVQQIQLGDKLDYAEAMDVLQRRIEQQ